MRLPVVVGLGLALPMAALACPPRAETAQADAHEAPTTTADAGACAKSAELVGSGCSYTTGMMAQRILAEGSDFAFTGNLTRTDAPLNSHVAAPFTVGENVRVVANEVIETAPLDSRVALTGKRLEVGGVNYFVVTAVTPVNES